MPVEQPADLLLHGGPIITLDPALPHADALLVRGPNIVAVGSYAAVSAAARPGARVVDLAGRTATRYTVFGAWSASPSATSGGVLRFPKPRGTSCLYVPEKF